MSWMPMFWTGLALTIGGASMAAISITLENQRLFEDRDFREKWEKMYLREFTDSSGVHWTTTSAVPINKDDPGPPGFPSNSFVKIKPEDK